MQQRNICFTTMTQQCGQTDQISYLDLARNTRQVTLFWFCQNTQFQ